MLMLADQRPGIYKSRGRSHATSVYIARIYDITYNIKAASTINVVQWCICYACSAAPRFDSRYSCFCASLGGVATLDLSHILHNDLSLPARAGLYLGHMCSHS